ncbi:hypothetical protein [Frankia canadensis]|nr:hypothetical protein [Frankia canadensis]
MPDAPASGRKPRARPSAAVRTSGNPRRRASRTRFWWPVNPSSTEANWPIRSSPSPSIFDGPKTYGARAQVLHAALDTGIARGALDAAVAQVTKAGPWFESGAARAADEPLLLQQAGDLEIEVRAAEALLREAASASTRPT